MGNIVLSFIENIILEGYQASPRKIYIKEVDKRCTKW